MKGGIALFGILGSALFKSALPLRAMGGRRGEKEAADQQHHDRGTDQEADDRIGEGEAEPDPDHAGDHGQGGEPVGAGMDAVGDQGRGADPAAHSDPVDRDGLVAGEPDQPGGQHPAQVGDRLRLDEPADRLHPGHHRGDRDHGHDE